MVTRVNETRVFLWSKQMVILAVVIVAPPLVAYVFYRWTLYLSDGA